MGMKVLAFDPHHHKAEGVKTVATVDEIIENADIISLHCPAIKSTKGMINSTFLSKIKKDCTIINTARGALVIDKDLIAHLDANKGFWSASDVWNGEPSAKEGEFHHDLAKHPQVYGTHHIGASTKQAEAEIGEEVVRIVECLVSKGDIDESNWVNSAGFSAKLDAKL